MFWDTVAPLYNLFENIYNGSVNKQKRHAKTLRMFRLNVPTSWS